MCAAEWLTLRMAIKSNLHAEAQLLPTPFNPQPLRYCPTQLGFSRSVAFPNPRRENSQGSRPSSQDLGVNRTPDSNTPPAAHPTIEHHARHQLAGNAGHQQCWELPSRLIRIWPVRAILLLGAFGCAAPASRSSWSFCMLGCLVGMEFRSQVSSCRSLRLMTSQLEGWKWSWRLLEK